MATYVRPNSLSHALEVRAAGAEVLSGGTDFWPARVGKPAYGGPDATILDLSALSDLRGIDARAERHADWRADHLVGPGRGRSAARVPGVADGGARGRRPADPESRHHCRQPVQRFSRRRRGAAAARARRPGRTRRQRRCSNASAAEFILGPRRTALKPDEVMTALLVPEPHPAITVAFHQARRPQVSAHLDRHGRGAADRAGRAGHRCGDRRRGLLAGGDAASGARSRIDRRPRRQLGGAGRARASRCPRADRRCTCRRRIPAGRRARRRAARCLPISKVDGEPDAMLGDSDWQGAARDHADGERRAPDIQRRSIDAAFRRAARRLRAHRYQGRLQCRRLRRLHRR